ncbi:SMP-30/gluconolactonase/LRE family protein [Hydrogenophaga sp. BPS33]|uniref:SMP-30/gluconolactonase/LRE family protein n=1 Tax=Hydrogenophaga sp. BPS33 TaxID=2651974 RepID=UPI00132026C6|nr:SMP-30/gluconolactonase/LRE family protein [Hydrogenophaga sp. BPS33]QHE84737.1 SMP-30/gluconolactonase/LRE family protein [Hydrogenophaga sp. BPS33]
MINEAVEFAVELRFPEGPVVMQDGSVIVVEIAAGCVIRCWPDGRVTTIAVVGGGPNGAALGPDGKLYVCNNGGMAWHRDPDGGLYPHGRAENYTGGSIQRVSIENGTVETLYRDVGGTALSAPNDIVFDESGGFWFTDLGEISGTHIARGGVCYARCDGTCIRQVVFPMLTPNGIALSPDGKSLYVAETLTARLWRFEVVAPGELALRSWPAISPGDLLYVAPEYCNFDSIAVEANGNICVATLGIGGITVVSPSGQRVEFVAYPDRATTNLCFGGADMRSAYVTQSRTGRLLMQSWAREGLAPAFGRQPR